MNVMDENKTRDAEQDKYHYTTQLLQTLPLCDHVCEFLWQHEWLCICPPY